MPSGQKKKELFSPPLMQGDYNTPLLVLSIYNAPRLFSNTDIKRVSPVRIAVYLISLKLYTLYSLSASISFLFNSTFIVDTSLLFIT